MCAAVWGSGRADPRTLQHLSCLFPSVAGPPRARPFNCHLLLAGVPLAAGGATKAHAKEGFKAWPASALPPKFVCPCYSPSYQVYDPKLYTRYFNLNC